MQLERFQGGFAYTTGRVTHAERGSITNSYVQQVETRLRSTQTIFDEVLMPLARPVLGKVWDGRSHFRQLIDSTGEGW